MKKFKLNPLAAVVSSLAVAGTAQFAVAQDDAPMIEEEEVIVTGFRRTLLNSIDAKRNADTIVEAISAEDIGGLPDASIADSLARLPGVTTERTGGEAGNIQIRGLSGDYVFATLNGREQVSPSNDRTIEFNQYPAELLSEVAVYKTPKASLIEGGVAGTVELRTSNPLDMSTDQKFHVSGRLHYNDYAKNVAGAQETGSRFTISYQGKFLDETLGVSLGYARFDQGSVAAEYNGLPWGAPGSQDTVTFDDGVERSISNGFELHQTGGEEIRDGYMAAIQYEPNDNLTIQADVFLSEFESSQYSRGFIIQRLSGFEIDNPIYNSDGDVIGGQFTLLPSTRTSGPAHGGQTNANDQGFQVNSNDVTDTDEVLSTGFEVKWEEDTWELSLDLSRSEASGRNEDGFVRAHLYGREVVDGNGDPILDSNGDPVIDYTETGRVSNLAFSYLNQPGSIPQITFNDAADFTNVDPTQGPAVQMSTYERYPHVNDDELDAMRIDGKFMFEDFAITSVEAGLRWSDRHYTNGRETFVYSIYDGDPSNQAAQPISLADANVSISDWEGDYSHLPSFPEFDADAVFYQALADEADFLRDENGELRDPTPRARWSEGRAWSMVERADVTEEVLAAYVMANFEFEVLDRELTGNVGIRTVDTTQAATALVPADPANGLPAVDVRDGLGQLISDVPQIGGTAYNEQFQQYGAAFVEVEDQYRINLPSLNVSYNLTDQDVLRFAAAKVISRAPINRLANDIQERYNRVEAGEEVYFEYSVNASNNPTIRPFEANQYDLSYERYFEETEGALAVAVYYKDIQNRLQTVSFEQFEGWAEFGFEPNRIYNSEADRDPVTGLPEVMPLTADVRDGDFTVALNNDDAGYVQGLELSYTQTFTMLPEPFDTFGMAATYARADSEITIPNPFTGNTAATLSLPGLAENSGNLTLFWEYMGVEARISANYQDEKVGELFNPTGGAGRITTFEAQTFVDFQVSYAFDFGMDVLFQISNLTDEMNKSYYGNKYNTATIQQFGRNFYIGVNYTFE